MAEFDHLTAELQDTGMSQKGFSSFAKAPPPMSPIVAPVASLVLPQSAL